MQKSEKQHSDGKGSENKKFLKRLTEKLADKDEGEVRRRLSATVRFFLCATAAYLLGGVELFFSTFPLGVALACSHKNWLLPISVGLLLTLILQDAPAVDILAAAAVILIRVLIFLVPKLLSIEKTGKELIKYDRELPEEQKAQKGEERELFCENIRVRLLCAAVGGLISGVARLISGDFSFYSLCATFFLTLGTPLIVLLLDGVFGGAFGGRFGERSAGFFGGEGGHRREWQAALAIGAVFFFCVFSSLDKTLLGMPMAPFLATLLTLYICSDRGIFLGIATALACGVSLELSYLPLLLLIALIFCLVSAVKKNMGLPAVCALVVVWCYYVGGERGLISYLPPMLLAIPFYYIADKYREMMRAPYLRDGLALSGVFFAEAVTEKTKNEVAFDRLEALTEAFSSLSETFYDLSDRFRRPDVLGIKKISEAAFEKHCEGCRNREICWGSDYARTLEAIKCVSAELHKKGVAAKECLDSDFTSACIRHERIIEEVNRSLKKTTEKMIRGEKIDIFSSNYDDMTAILKDALESDSGEYESDIEAGNRVFDYLASAGVRPRGVVVYGKRCRRVVARGVVASDRIGEGKLEKIRGEVEKIVGFELSEPKFEVGKDGNVMVMHSKPTVRAYCSHGNGKSLDNGGKSERSCESNEEIFVDPFADRADKPFTDHGAERSAVCGDTTSAFVTDASYFYSLISDGMGSGEEAAFTSSVCAIFIEKMLSAGNRADITLRMLNNVIRSENLGLGSECSATVDLFELDLMSGTASFIKSGAAPTYVARGGTVYKISSRTMPVGIIRDADARITRFDTQKGDIIVMMSDGCCPDSDDCAWLVEYLCAYAKKSARGKAVELGESKDEQCARLRDEILSEAIKNFPADRPLDDISVSVVLID